MYEFDLIFIYLKKYLHIKITLGFMIFTPETKSHIDILCFCYDFMTYKNLSKFPIR